MTSSHTSPPARRAGLTGFMTTIPGVLTAVAALVTAAGGIYLGTGNHTLATPTAAVPVAATSTHVPVAATSTPTPPPPPPQTVAPTSVRSPGRAAGDLSQIPNSSGGDSAQQLLDSCAQGDESACITILDLLVQGCSDGNGLSCDVLYEVSPAGSDDEAYGATCGGRFSADVADNCRFQ